MRDSSKLLARILTAAQRAALEHVRTAAARDRDGHRARIAAALVERDPDALIAGIRRRARITINFHPDRVLADGRTVADGLHDDGVYRSQFETRIANAGPPAILGGERDRREERLFGGAYQRWHVTSPERPKHGGLDVLRRGRGAFPRFGSCHLRLRADLVARTTLALGDALGTVDALEPVLAALGERSVLDLAALVRAVAGDDSPRIGDGEPDHAIEAHVHGELRVARDAEAVVIDPSFRGTHIGERLEALAARHRVALESHAGLELAADEVPGDDRALGRRVAERAGRDRLDAAAIGAAFAVEPDPALERLWHIVVAAGRPPGTVDR